MGHEETNATAGLYADMYQKTQGSSIGGVMAVVCKVTIVAGTSNALQASKHERP
jgi:hypothetical protein